MSYHMTGQMKIPKVMNWSELIKEDSMAFDPYHPIARCWTAWVPLFADLLYLTKVFGGVYHHFMVVSGQMMLFTMGGSCGNPSPVTNKLVVILHHRNYKEIPNFMNSYSGLLFVGFTTLIPIILWEEYFIHKPHRSTKKSKEVTFGMVPPSNYTNCGPQTIAKLIEITWYTMGFMVDISSFGHKPTKITHYCLW